MKKILLVVAFCPMSLTAWGQRTGAVTGSVLDASGSAVPNAKVTATNVATNVTTSVQSTGAGVYTIPGLAPGKYRIEAAVAGFKTYRLQEPVVVFTASAASLDIHMEVGEVTQTLEVSGADTPLKLHTAELSTEIGSKSLFNLPLQLGEAGTTGRRTIDSFITLAPGVTGFQFDKSFNGSQIFTSDTIIDGISWQISIVPGVIGTFGPPYEAMEEFEVQTTLFPAEYSRGVGLTNFTTKSGANSFHGNAFEILRNDKLEANSFFANAAGIPRSIVRQNEWGASIGGPIKKDKTFFYFAYTGFKRRGGSPFQNLVTLPTPAMRRGDFSEWLDPETNGTEVPIVIYDPQSTRPDGEGGFVRDPFPGNIIPQKRISGVASRFVDLLPDPDGPGLLGNYVSRSGAPTDDWDWSVKVNHQASAKQKISCMMWIQKDGTRQHGDVPGSLDNGYFNDEVGRGIRFNHDYFISPNVIHHFGFGYGRRRTDVYPPEEIDKTNDYFQIPAIGNFEFKPAAPAFYIGGLPQPLGTWVATVLERGNNYNVLDNVSWLKGKHSIKTGIDFRWYQYNTWFCDDCQSYLSFGKRLTSQPNSPDFAVLGHPFASFLLGQVGRFNQGRDIANRGFRNGYFSGFAQDSYKLTPKLTIDYGLRFEVPVPVAEAYDRLSVLDVHRPNPGAGGLPGALMFAGEGEGRIGKRRFVDIHHEWSPRFGIAYQLNDKTVIRTGFGIFHTQTNGNAVDAGLVGALGAGYQSKPFFSTLDNGVTPAFLLDNGPPIVDRVLPSVDPTLSNNSLVDFLNPDSGKTAYVNSWALSVQRELPKGILIDAAYVGQHGVNLAGALENINQVSARYLSLGSLLTADITDPAAAAAGILPPYLGFSGSVAQALRPFPQYTEVVQWQEPTAANRYHSFQLKVEKRFSEGSSFLISYTAAKNITNAASNSGFSVDHGRPPDTEKRHLEWAVADNDIPQNLVASFVYELPLGPGKRFVNQTGTASKIIGGWQIAAIARYSKGAPIAIGGGQTLPLFGGANRPNRVPGVDIRTGVSAESFDPEKDRWLNINAFEAGEPFTFGNLGPRLPNTRQFPFLNEDFTISKFIRFTEHHQLELRAEFYNIFNRVNFADIGTNIDDPASFGKVFGTWDPRHIQIMLKYHF